MIDVGMLNKFGFRIAPASDASQLREISIFVNSYHLTHRDNAAYLPNFVGHLIASSDSIKCKIDYLKYEHLFRDLNVTQIHNLLLHGNPDVFADDEEWRAVSAAHRFAEWGVTTDGTVVFLIPHFDRLYLTYQSCEPESSEYETLDVIDGVQTTPYYLIDTIDKAVSILTKET